MKLYDARYERTYKVVDYESAKYALAAILDEGENAVEAFVQMKQMVVEAHGDRGVAVEKTTNTKVPATKTATKESLPKTETAAKEEPKKEEVKEVPKKEEPKKEEAPKKEEPKKEKKVTKSITTYVRQNDDHRGKMGSLLDEVCPGWRENLKSRDAGKLASTELEGKDFIDEKGNFVDSFVAEVKKRMSPFTKDDL